MELPPFPHRLVTHGQLIRHDPLLGHAFVASVHRRVPHERGAYFSVTNQQGFRDDHDWAMTDSGFHVLCFGDSYAAGDGVDNAERFSAILGQQLGLKVSNVAVPGYGPDQNLLQLEQLTLPRPDLILWCIAVHTIERIQSGHRITVDREGRLWQVGRPHFLLAGDGTLHLQGVPVAEQGVELREPPGPQIQNRLAATCSRAAAKLRSSLVSALGTYLRPSPDPDYAAPDSSGWQLLSALVRRFHSAAGQVPVAIVPLPTAHYLAENHQPHFQRRFAELERKGERLHVLDVITGMRRATRFERISYHGSDGHYTARGHQAVADVLAEQLRDRGLVPRTLPMAVDAPNRHGQSTFTLHVGWDLDDGYAQLRSTDQVIAEHRESEITQRSCRPGVLALAAIHACLEEGRIAGPELQAVVLHSPCALHDLSRSSQKDAHWFGMLSGWIRWRGGAEVDLRKFLGFQGCVEWRTSERVLGTGAPSSSDMDEELHWMQQQIQHLPEGTDGVRMDRWLQRVASRWERATRSARESVLPSTAPLRRGRMAQQLAQTRESKTTQWAHSVESSRLDA